MNEFHEIKQNSRSTHTKDIRCPFCSMQCSMELLENENGFQAKPNKKDPTSEGRLCMKGFFAYEPVIHPDRIQYPLKKVNGKFIRIPWDEALEEIAKRFKELQAIYGKDSVGVYGGGSLTNEEAYLLGKFARIGIQTKYIDYNGRFCMSAAASAANATFGIDRGITNQLSEIEDAKCIILAGTNIGVSQPTMMSYFTRAKKNGAFIIAIDPRETPTTKLANLHLKIRPGMDANLAIGMLKVIVEEGYTDEAFIENRTNGFDTIKEQLQNISLVAISELTGISIKEIQTAARHYGKAKTGMLFTARGVEQHASGFQTVRQFLHLVLATGKIGKHACGYGAITGQANGQGGREHGQKADQLPGYRSIENEADRKYIASIWEVEEKEIPKKGVSAYELIQKIDEEEIKALFLMGSNPAVSSPNALFVENALKKLDFLVAVDMYVTETARMAHIILPTSSFLEDEGTMTNLEGRVVYRAAKHPPPGEAKHDWQIICQLANALGCQRSFSYHFAEEIFNELRVASKGGTADYYGITYSRVKKSGGVFWPCPKEDHLGTIRLFEKEFMTENKRANFGSIEFQYPKETQSNSYPLILTTGRVTEHYLTGVQTRRSKQLMERMPNAFVEIHPNTAKRFEIEEGDLVKIESVRGTCVVTCKITERIREDSLFAPMHWGDAQCINRVTNDALDPVCRMPEFKVSAVSIQRYK